MVKAVKWGTATGPEEVHQELELGTDRIIEFKNPFCDWSNFLSVLNRRLLNILDVFENFGSILTPKIFKNHHKSQNNGNHNPKNPIIGS